MPTKLYDFAEENNIPVEWLKRKAEAESRKIQDIVQSILDAAL